MCQPLTPGLQHGNSGFMGQETDVKSLQEMMRTQACREFTLEFICPIVAYNPYAVRLLGNTISRAMKESALRLAPGFWLRSRKRYQWKVNIGCYDLNAETRAIKEILIGISAIADKGSIHCRRGKVKWPSIGPRTKPTTVKPSLAAQLEMWEKHPAKARKLQKRLEAEISRDYQRRSRNKKIYKISR